MFEQPRIGSIRLAPLMDDLHRNTPLRMVMRPQPLQRRRARLAWGSLFQCAACHLQLRQFR